MGLRRGCERQQPDAYAPGFAACRDIPCDQERDLLDGKACRPKQPQAMIRCVFMGVFMRRARMTLLAAGVLLPLSVPAFGQKSGVEPEPAPAPLSGQPAMAGTAASEGFGSESWCTLPLCREAQVMRKTGDLRGALKIYRYIQDEVDVDEKVVAKPLLWFVIAGLHAELGQAQPASDALEKYKQYIATRADADLPQGQRRSDVDRLTQSLRTLQGRLRIGQGLAGVHVFVDGKDVGVLPLAAPLPISPGVHRIEFGGTPLASQELEVAAGQEVVLLPPNPQTASAQYMAMQSMPSGRLSDREPRPTWRIALGAAGLLIGAGLIAGAIAPLRADGTCVGGGAPPCPTAINAAGQPVTRVVDGRGVGGTLLGFGIASAVAGTVLLALPGKRRQASAALQISGAGSVQFALSY